MGIEFTYRVIITLQNLMNLGATLDKRRQKFGFYLLIHLGSSILRLSDGLILARNPSFAPRAKNFLSLYILIELLPRQAHRSCKDFPFFFLYILGLFSAMHVNASKYCIFFYIYIYIDFNYLIKIIRRLFSYILWLC